MFNIGIAEVAGGAVGGVVLAIIILIVIVLAVCLIRYMYVHYVAAIMFLAL